MAESQRIVVIAIDKSKQAEHAFDWYRTYIHRPENEVYLVHIPEGTQSSQEGITQAEWEQQQVKEKQSTQDLRSKYEKKMRDNNINGQMKSLSGKPGEVIVAAAKEANANLIVMGTRGMGTIRRTIIGSVSDFVIHHSHVPVIVCRQ